VKARRDGRTESRWRSSDGTLLSILSLAYRLTKHCRSNEWRRFTHSDKYGGVFSAVYVNSRVELREIPRGRPMSSNYRHLARSR
jgi:hypothetical protein